MITPSHMLRILCRSGWSRRDRPDGTSALQSRSHNLRLLALLSNENGSPWTSSPDWCRGAAGDGHFLSEPHSGGLSQDVSQQMGGTYKRVYRSPHAACLVQKWLESQGIDQMAHPPYSPDLATCDFWPFSALKMALCGRHLQTDAEVLQAMDTFFQSLTPEDFHKTFHSKWEECTNVCIEAHMQHVLCRSGWSHRGLTRWHNRLTVQISPPATSGIFQPWKWLSTDVISRLVLRCCRQWTISFRASPRRTFTRRSTANGRNVL